MYVKRNGWGIAQKTFVNGTQYESKFEAGYAQDLELLLKAGEISGYNTHVAIPLRVNGELITTYKIDFVVMLNDGTTEYVETKGRFDMYARLRWKLFQAIVPKEYPRSKCVLVMQKSQWNNSARWKKRSG